MAKGAIRRRLWGPWSRLGFAVAAIVLAVDQAHKWWMLEVYRIAERGTVRVAPFLDLVLVWNPGISYGLLPQDSDLGQTALVAVAVAAVAALTVWLAQLRAALAAVAVGLVMGGAAGNAIDRLAHGAVADFFSFHAFGYHWYVFNIADAAIVAGVAGLLYESVFGSHKKVSKTS